MTATALRTAFTLMLLALLTPPSSAEQADSALSVQEVREMLNSVDHYLPADPEKDLNVEIDVFGSTSMDSLAHGWASGFKQFHPNAKVVISAEGTDSVFERLSKSPASVGMLSRPVTAEDLKELKEMGLVDPIAISVARQALGVFVHKNNPLESISREQFELLFCAVADSQPLKWQEVAVEGELADQPVEILDRSARSGTQKFIAEYLFGGLPLRKAKQTFTSNSEMIAALQQNPRGIAICGLRCGGHSAKLLHLLHHDTIIPSDDHTILLGHYPLIRPLTLVLDKGQKSPEAHASREFVRYALDQEGQAQAILSGFFPFDPPLLRGELLKLKPAAAQ